VDYHHTVRRLHFAGASLREIAHALDLSHQRVHQIVEAGGGTASGKPGKKDGLDRFCTFCGLPEAEVAKLVAGPGVYVCDACVALVRQVLRQRGPVETPRTRIDLVIADDGLRCSFCGAPDVVVGGPGVRMCDRCVQLSEEIVTAR